ncbi:MAG: hypothetical protein KBD14_00565 [Candidatus Pacebacteria bacterium]|nr:hypothetical protein [Candidatus Paceibacterota bacterium]
MNKFKNQKLNKGFSLIEMVFYISIFIVLSLVTIDAIIALTKSFKTTKVNIELAQAGTIIEKISREIKQAESVTVSSSTDITINTFDENGNDKVIRYLLSGTNLEVYENGSGSSSGNLNPSNIKISSLSFTDLNTTLSNAVRIYMRLGSNHYNSTKEVEYYNTVVLRGGY